MEQAFRTKGYMAPLDANPNEAPGTIPLEEGSGFYQLLEDGTAEMTSELYDLLEDVWYPFLEWRDDVVDDLEGMSYAEAIDIYMDEENVDDVERQQFLNLMEDAMEVEYTGDSSNVNVEWIEFHPPGYSSSVDYLSIPGMGFGNLAASYAEPIMDYINLNCKVTEIDSSNNDKDASVVRYVEDGVEKAVYAKTILVTVSLGVLKAGDINFV